jgi:ectoine hydroxylase-related dioxygenase (phytanoyl-CoA dioxygenase family)
MDAFENQVGRLQLQGYTILPDLLTTEECEEAVRELERILREEARGEGPETLNQVYPTGGWAYNLMNKSRIFERPYQIPELRRAIRHFLGDDAVLQAVMGRRVLPGSPEQPLHYDGSLTGPFRAGAEADEGRRNVEMVFGLNVIFCLTDFTRRNGGTRLVPGSHRLATREVPQDSAPPGEIAIEAPRGSALVFNIATWHGQSAHVGDETRYAVLTPWRRGWLRPEADLSRMVRADVLERAGPEGRTIFGFAARPPYVERWMWDVKEGRPKPEWRHLERDEWDEST